MSEQINMNISNHSPPTIPKRQQMVKFFFEVKNPVQRINFWKFEDWNIVLAYLLAMEGSNKTPYEPNNAEELAGYGRV